jgi:hypothetical protein
MVIPYRARNILAQPICAACGDAMHFTNAEPNPIIFNAEDYSYVCQCGYQLKETIAWKR